MSEWHGKQRRRPDGRDRGRTPARHCVDLPSRGDGWRAQHPTPVAVAQPVERPSETRGAAGSTPAGHIARDSVAQEAELPALNRRVAGSTPAGVTRGSGARLLPGHALASDTEGLPSARYPVSKTGGSHRLGGSTPSPSVVRIAHPMPVCAARPRMTHAGTRASEAWPSGKAAPCYGVGASSASAGSSPAASVPFPPRSSVDESSGLRTHARPFESGRGARTVDPPRVAQLRRAPLLQGGGWGFESLTADTQALEAQLGRAAAL